MFLTLLFNRMISPNEFEDAIARLIPDEATRNLLLDCVAEIYLSFEDCDDQGSNIYTVSETERVMMTSSTIDVFIPEVGWLSFDFVT